MYRRSVRALVITRSDRKRGRKWSLDPTPQEKFWLSAASITAVTPRQPSAQFTCASSSGTWRLPNHFTRRIPGLMAAGTAFSLEPAPGFMQICLLWLTQGRFKPLQPARHPLDEHIRRRHRGKVGIDEIALQRLVRHPRSLWNLRRPWYMLVSSERSSEGVRSVRQHRTLQ